MISRLWKQEEERDACVRTMTELQAGALTTDASNLESSWLNFITSIMSYGMDTNMTSTALSDSSDVKIMLAASPSVVDCIDTEADTVQQKKK